MRERPFRDAATHVSGSQAAARLALAAAILAFARSHAVADTGTPDPAAPKLLATVAPVRPAHERRVDSVTWVDGGRGIVSRSGAEVVRWDSQRATKLWSVSASRDTVTAVAVADSGPAVLAQGEAVDLLRADGKSWITASASGRVRAVAIDATGTTAVTFEWTRTDASTDCLVARRAADGAELWRRVVKCVQGALWISFSSDGRRVAWMDRPGQLFSAAADGKGPVRLHGCVNGRFAFVAALAPNRWLLRETEYMTLVEVTTGPPDDETWVPLGVRRLRPDLDTVECADAADDGRVVVGLSSGELLLAGIDDAARDQRLAAFGAKVTAVDWFPGAPGLAAAGLADGSIRVIDATGADRSFPLTHRSPVTAVESSDDGSTYATVDDSGRVVVWSAATREALRSVEGLRAPIALSHDGSALAGCTETRAVQMVAWDEMVSRSVPMPIADGVPNVLRFVPRTRKTLVGGSTTETSGGVTLRLLDPAAGIEIYSVGPCDAVITLCVTADGAKVVTASVRGLRIHDTATGRVLDGRGADTASELGLSVPCAADLDAQSGACLFAATGPLRDRLRAAWIERFLEAGGATKDLRRLDSAIDRITSARWLPGGRWAILAGAESSAMPLVSDRAAPGTTPDVEIFDTKRGGAPARSWRTPGGVASMAVADGGRALVTVSSAGVIRVWDLAEACPSDGK